MPPGSASSHAECRSVAYPAVRRPVLVDIYRLWCRDSSNGSSGGTGEDGGSERGGNGIIVCCLRLIGLRLITCRYAGVRIAGSTSLLLNGESLLALWRRAAGAE